MITNNTEMIRTGRRLVERMSDSAGFYDTCYESLTETCMTYTDYASVLAFLADSMGSAEWDEKIADLISEMLGEYIDLTI